MELTYPNKRAVGQIMTVFTKEQQKEFNEWLTLHNESYSSASKLIFGHPYYLLNLNSYFEAEVSIEIPIEIERILSTLRVSYSPNKTCYLIGSYLLFVLNQQRRGQDITLIILSIDTLRSLLNTKYSPEHFTPSEIRVLAQLISDPEIKHAATQDNVEVSTKETHYKAAARKIGARKRAGLIADLTALLLLEITVASRPHSESSQKVMNEYRERYLPSAVKLITLTANDGTPHNFLDMGPKSGNIIIVLHPMILPDIRGQDIDFLHKLGIRLVWPLRHGFLSPKAKVLTVEKQLQETITSIELAREYYCDDPFVLAAMITSGWYAIRYAELYPQNVKSLLFAGACYRKDGKKSLSMTRQFGQGLISLATNSPKTINYVLNFVEKHFRQHKKFCSLMDTVFSGSTADMEILNQEMDKPGFKERFFFALQNSFPSLQHDLLHQTNMGWSKLRCIEVPTHFAHGDDNVVTTPSDIKDLVNSLPNSKLYILKDCGQLMYYKHFESLAQVVRKL